MTEKNVRAADQAFPPQDHDHHRCTAALVARVREACEAQNIRLTGLRERVLEEIASSHKAVGAYDLIDRLARKGGPRLAPISVYRALEALAAVGAIHRIESRNAFFACHAKSTHDDPRIVLVCEDCLTVAEVASPESFQAIAAAAGRSGFRTARRVVELSGRCRSCVDGRPAGEHA